MVRLTPEQALAAAAQDRLVNIVSAPGSGKTTIAAEATPNTVVALMGVGSLFGLARVSSVVEGIKDAVGGRLVVFFPGEYHPENHAYRLLDARDGWNYLAVPLLAKEA